MAPSGKPDPYTLSDGGGGMSPGEAVNVGPEGRFIAKRQQGAHVITLSRADILDAFYIEQIGGDLKAYIQAAERPLVVVDLENVTHLSSAALGMLVTLRTTCTAQNGQLCLARVRKDLVEIFKLTKLDKILKNHGTIEDAIASLK